MPEQREDRARGDRENATGPRRGPDEGLDRPGDPAGHALGIAQGQGFGHELTQDERDECDRQDHDRQGDGLGPLTCAWQGHPRATA